MRRLLQPLCLIIPGCWVLSGCGLGYYWQAAQGHLALMDQREPVAEVLADPATPESRRRRLEYAQAALDFAHAGLGLPDNGSYRQYADIGRDFVVWNVVSAPAFSLEPRTWCFPVAGCVSYRGYFDEQRAKDFAAGLAAQGNDTFVGGVTAYSTLGRFADPLTSPMLEQADYRLAGLIFHELAHQQVYLPGDTVFNESFASTVEQAGVRRWLAVGNDESSRCEFEIWLVRRTQVRELLNRSRVVLAALYLQDLAPTAAKAAKQAALQSLRQDYMKLRQEWTGPPYFDGWFGPRLNNASLAALSAYDQYVPAFGALLARHGGDFPAFYQAVADLAASTDEQRRAELVALGRDSFSPPATPTHCLQLATLNPGKPAG